MIDASLYRASPKGNVSIANGTMQVVFHRSYRKPVEKVWAALTTPERLEDWFGAAKIDLRQGGSFVFTYPNGYETTMTISRLEAPRSLGWIWTLGGVDTEVLFDLTPTSEGCSLTLTHSNVPEGGRGVRAGWHAHLEGLADCLEGMATPWASKTEREKLYEPLYRSGSM